MISWSRLPILIIPVCVWLLLPSCLQAQQAGPAPAPAEPKAKERTERKKPGWLFHHPKAKTPGDQLEYANGLLATGHRREAAKQYYALVCTWHESPQAPAAQLAYAKLVEDRGDSLDAFNEFQYLIDHFAGRFPFDEALDHQFRIANDIMTARHGTMFVFRGYTTPERALPLFEQIVKNGPGWGHTPEVQFNIGGIHESNRDFEEATKAYEVVMVSYPHSPQAEDAAFHRAQCLYVLANANRRNEVSYREALSALSMFQRDYPKNVNAATAKKYLDELKERLADMYFERALFYDRIAKRPKSAVIAYADFLRNFPTSELASRANERMDTLKLEMERHHEP